MARDALGKLREAEEARKLAVNLKKVNPGAADKLVKAAERKENSAVRQMTRLPKKKSHAGGPVMATDGEVLVPGVRPLIERVL